MTYPYVVPPTSKIVPADVIVFRKGNLAIAIKGDTKETIASSTDHAEAIQAAINYLTEGGRIFIKNGIYLLHDKDGDGYCIVINNKSNIEIVGDKGATLKLDDNIFTESWSSRTQYMLRIINSSYITVKNLVFDANRDGGNNGNVLGIWGNGASTKVVVEENVFLNTYGHAVYINNAHDNKVLKNIFYNNTWYDIALDTHSHRNIVAENVIINGIGMESFGESYYNCFINNIIADQRLDVSGEVKPAINIEGRNLIKANILYNIRGSGIVLEGSELQVVEGNILYNTVTDLAAPNGAIYVAVGSSNKIIKNNIIINPEAGYGGIVIRGDNCLVEGNYVTGFASHGIIEYSRSNNRIIGNRVLNNGVYDIRLFGSSNCKCLLNDVSESTSSNKISDEGTGNVVKYNIGYLTENSGTATIPAGSTSVTVEHGLASTPSKVIVTPIGDPGDRWWVANVGDTSFEIHVATAPSADIKFYWHAEV